MGVTSGRGIGATVRAGIEEGRLTGDEKVKARVARSIEQLGHSTDIDVTIDLA